MGTRFSFPGVKRLGREADHSPPSSAEVKEWVELYLNSPMHLHGVVLSYSTGTTLTLPLPLVLIFISCRYKSVVTKIITLQSLHYTESDIIFLKFSLIFGTLKMFDTRLLGLNVPICAR
jgi:hypothetical protein